MRKRWMLLMLLILTAAMLAACGGKNEKSSSDQKNGQTEPKKEDAAVSGTGGGKQIETVFKNTEGDAIGSAILEPANSGVKIKLDVSKLPAGTHGFHIHEKGSCVAPDFESAGAHFNPTHAKHGKENPEGPHAGDLDNLNVGEDGEVKTEVTTNLVTLEEGKENSLLRDGGTSLVIHADPDDYKSQPAGNAGKRIACAEIHK